MFDRFINFDKRYVGNGDFNVVDCERRSTKYFFEKAVPPNDVKSRGTVTQ